MAVERQVVPLFFNHVDFYLYHDQGGKKNKSGALKV